MHADNSGIILISTLLYLAILTLLVISTLQTNILETKMSVNYKKNIFHLYQAEIKLRTQELLLEEALEQGIERLPAGIALISSEICGVNFYRIKFRYNNEILQSTYAVMTDTNWCNSKPNIRPGRQSWVHINKI